MSDKYPRVRVTSANFRDAMYSTRRELPGDEMPFKAVPADAIVIERDELPEVQTNGHDLQARGAGSFVGIDDSWEAPICRSEALAYLALAEYLAAHPPVDEAQVEALASAIRASDVERGHPDAGDSCYREMATDLYRVGVRHRSTDKHELEG